MAVRKPGALNSTNDIRALEDYRQAMVAWYQSLPITEAIEVLGSALRTLKRANAANISAYTEALALQDVIEALRQSHTGVTKWGNLGAEHSEVMSKLTHC